MVDQRLEDVVDHREVVVVVLELTSPFRISTSPSIST
jgi:hypothetical protein